MPRPAPARLLVLVASILVVGSCVDNELPLATLPTGSTAGMAPLFSTGDAVPDRYIVVFRDAPGTPEPQSRADVEREVASLGGHADRFYQHVFRGFAGTLPPQAVTALRRNPRVAYVEQDAVVSIEGGPGQQGSPTWGLDRIDQRSVTLDNLYRYPATGAGVSIYVLDTGVRISHSQFGGRASYGWDTYDDDADADDCQGHGTHVAGSAGGSTYGVAKDAQLVAVRVLGCGGSGTAASVIAGMEWVRVNGSLPGVINMSLGAGASSAIDAAVSSVAAAGFVVVAAAGNSNTDACLASPARVPEAITVGSSNSADVKAGTSSWGTCLDLFAPGEGILSAFIGSDTDTRTTSGTSMAAPHVAGAAAVLLELDPDATPADIANALIAAATLNVITSPGTGSPNRLLYLRGVQQITIPSFGTAPLLATGYVGVNATSTSGLPVALSTATPSVCSFALNWLILHAAGTCQVRANQAGNADWPAAPEVTSSVTVFGAVVPPTPQVAGPGGGHSCVLRLGVAHCWGWNGYDQALPTRAAATGQFTQLAVGSNFNCGLRNDGVVECWGNNDRGQAPASRTAASGGPYTQVAVGFDWACALRTTGIVDCWGHDSAGQARANSASTFLYGGRFVQVMGGGFTTCALRGDGVIECWGQEPGTHVAPGGWFVSMGAGWVHGCGLTNTGTVRCWGDNSAGQAPVSRAASVGTYTQLGVGVMSNCARRSDGVVECWGRNDVGQAPATRTTPGGFLGATAGTLHSCGVSASGLAVCWGNNGNGESRSEQTVAFTSSPPAAPIAGTGYAMTGSSSSGLAVVFSSLTSDTCTVSGGTATFTAAGTCTLAADQPGDATWLPAPRQTQSLSLGQALPPVAPTGVSASATSPTRIEVSWTDAADNETGFDVERRERTDDDAWGVYAALTTAAADATGITDTTPAEGSTYQYRVRACGPGACSTFVETPEVSTPLTLPLAPTALVVTLTSASTARLDWVDESFNEVRFSVGRRERNGDWTSWTEVAAPHAGVAHFDDSGLVPGRPYQWRVRACNLAGCSAVALSLITQVGAPPAPTGLTAAIVNAVRIRVTWDGGSDDETYFMLQRRMLEGDVWSAWDAVARPGAHQTSHLDVGLTSDRTYQYRIRACDTGGCSLHVTSQALLLPGVPPPPIDATSTPTSTSTIVTTWFDTGDAETGFTIDRRMRMGATWGAWASAGTVGTDVTTFSGTGLAAGTLYQFRVRACNATGCSAAVNAPSVTTFDVPPP